MHRAVNRRLDAARSTRASTAHSHRKFHLHPGPPARLYDTDWPVETPCTAEKSQGPRPVDKMVDDFTDMLDKIVDSDVDFMGNEAAPGSYFAGISTLIVVCAERKFTSKP